MQREYIHLAYLLTKHECVIIPGFGAFVAHPVNPLTIQAKGVFAAPARSLGFNPDLKHNDGLLVGSLSKAYQLTYEEANLSVRRFVDDLTDHLNTYKEIQMPGLGKVSLSLENKILFTPDHESVCNAANYGLSNFYFPSLNDIPSNQESPQKPEKSKDVIWIPLNRKFITVTGSVAATILALLTLSTPIDNKQIPAQYAGVITSFIHDQDVNKNDTKPDQADATFQSSAATSDIKPSRLYYVVIASCPTKKLADKTITDIRTNQFKQAEILITEHNSYRIYTDQFSDKEEAERFLQKFRTDFPKYKDAWLLSQTIDSKK